MRAELHAQPRELGERVVERAHLAPADADHLQRRLVQVRERRPGRIVDDDRLEVAEHRVLRGRRDALVRQHAGDRGRSPRGAARSTSSRFVLKKAREPVLLDEPVVAAGLELVEDLVAPRPDAQAAVAQERAQLHERPAVLDAAGAVARPDDGDAALARRAARAASPARSRAACARCRSRTSRTSRPRAGSRSGGRCGRARCGPARDPNARLRTDLESQTYGFLSRLRPACQESRRSLPGRRAAGRRRPPRAARRGCRP